jgi:hypothetical protein
VCDIWLVDPLRRPIRWRALDTHSIDLDSVAFEHAVALRTPDGADAPPTAVEQAVTSAVGV